VHDERDPVIRAARSASRAFEIGDHLRVRRRLGYFHHGIYIGDGEVVQFGGRIGDKRQAHIGIASLEAFESRGIAKRAEAGVIDRWSGLAYTEPDEPKRIVKRALWLVEHYPPGRYNVLGSNCETIANFCSTGGAPESLQTRGAIYVVRLAVVYPLIFLLLPYLRRRGWLTKRQASRAESAVYVVHLIPTAVWFWHRMRFIRFLRAAWPEIEQLLGEADA
jgi:hypothetical protein